MGETFTDGAYVPYHSSRWLVAHSPADLSGQPIRIVSRGKYSVGEISQLTGSGQTEGKTIAGDAPNNPDASPNARKMTVSFFIR